LAQLGGPVSRERTNGAFGFTAALLFGRGLSMSELRIHLSQAVFGEKERPFLTDKNFRVTLFRYESGVAAVRVVNSRGELVALPYLGQMLWDANFDGVRLTMDSKFPEPRPASSIIDTYGCLNYHAGILRNGPPTPPHEDHPLHGELPCAVMDRAWLELGVGAEGPFVRLVSEFNYAKAFGTRYTARPSLTLGAGHTQFAIGMSVQNMGALPMDIMYLCHLNFAFCEGGQIFQSAPYTADRTIVRTAVPSHVPQTPEFKRLIRQLSSDPGLMEILTQACRFDPEQVFYIRDPKQSPDGLVHFMLKRREGDGFSVSYDGDEFSHAIRWLLCNGDQRVAAFALPATCEPEGYEAEKRKGNVRTLTPGAALKFNVRAGYLDREAATAMAERICGASENGPTPN
jgi:hypothetical protein